MLRTFFDSAITHLFVAFAFLIGSFSLYSRLYRPREPLLIDLDQIQGEYLASYQNKCFGVITIKRVLTDDLTTLSADGQMFLQQGNDILPLKVTGEVNFNILGQFGNAIASFDLSGSVLRVGALGVDPIRIIIKTFQNNATVFQRELDIPGPILGKRVKDRFLAVEYEGLSTQLVQMPSVGVLLRKGAVSQCENTPLSLETMQKKVLAALPTIPFPIENFLRFIR